MQVIIIRNHPKLFHVLAISMTGTVPSRSAGRWRSAPCQKSQTRSTAMIVVRKNNEICVPSWLTPPPLGHDTRFFLVCVDPPSSRGVGGLEHTWVDHEDSTRNSVSYSTGILSSSESMSLGTIVWFIYKGKYGICLIVRFHHSVLVHQVILSPWTDKRSTLSTGKSFNRAH
jgi:hypothetical protein